MVLLTIAIPDDAAIDVADAAVKTVGDDAACRQRRRATEGQLAAQPPPPDMPGVIATANTPFRLDPRLFNGPPAHEA